MIMVNTQKKAIISILPLLITLLALLLMPHHTITAYASDTKISLSTTSLAVGTNYNKSAVIKGSIYGDVSSQYYVYGIDDNNLVSIQSGYTMSGSSFSLRMPLRSHFHPLNSVNTGSTGWEMSKGSSRVSFPPTL